jgi:deazaflavin-dependent oxidoreductase (nitroreductase family)
VSDLGIGEQLAGWGKVAIVETTGRTSGRAARAAVGFIEEPDGSLLVAAGSPEAGWARNLALNPACIVRIGALSGRFIAEPLEGTALNATISGLILRYGTPAEGLGRGPAFRLRPDPATSSVADDSRPSDDSAGGPVEGE